MFFFLKLRFPTVILNCGLDHWIEVVRKLSSGMADTVTHTADRLLYTDCKVVGRKRETSPKVGCCTLSAVQRHGRPSQQLLSSCYWHYSHGIWSKVYETVGRPSVCLSVRPTIRTQLRRVCCWAPCRQEISIDSGGRRAASSNSAAERRTTANCAQQQMRAVSRCQPPQEAEHRIVISGSCVIELVNALKGLSWCVHSSTHIALSAMYALPVQLPITKRDQGVDQFATLWLCTYMIQAINKSRSRATVRRRSTCLKPRQQVCTASEIWRAILYFRCIWYGRRAVSLFREMNTPVRNMVFRVDSKANILLFAVPWSLIYACCRPLLWAW